jgi:hypothetical protein
MPSDLDAQVIPAGSVRAHLPTPDAIVALSDDDPTKRRGLVHDAAVSSDDHAGTCGNAA